MNGHDQLPRLYDLTHPPESSPTEPGGARQVDGSPQPFRVVPAREPRREPAELGWLPAAAGILLAILALFGAVFGVLLWAMIR